MPVPPSSAANPLRAYLRRIYSDIPVEIGQADGSSDGPSGEDSQCCPCLMSDLQQSMLVDTSRALSRCLSSMMMNERRSARASKIRDDSMPSAWSVPGGSQACGMGRSNLASVKPGDEILVGCWRGGMRSSSVCWMLNLCGFRAATLDGGYRSFRRWVCAHAIQFARSPRGLVVWMQMPHLQWRSPPP